MIARWDTHVSPELSRRLQRHLEAGERARKSGKPHIYRYDAESYCCVTSFGKVGYGASQKQAHADSMRK